MSTPLKHPNRPQAPDSPPPTPSTLFSPSDIRKLFQPLATEFINVAITVDKHREITAWMEKWQERHETATAKDTTTPPTKNRTPTPAELIKYIALLINQSAATLDVIDRTHTATSVLINRSFDTCKALFADKERIHKFKMITKDLKKEYSAWGAMWHHHSMNCFEGNFDTSRAFAEHGGLENMRVNELRLEEEQWSITRGGLVAVMEGLQGMVEVLEGKDD